MLKSGTSCTDFSVFSQTETLRQVVLRSVSHMFHCGWLQDKACQIICTLCLCVYVIDIVFANMQV